MMTAKLYLIPTPLGEYAPSDVLPAPVLDQICLLYTSVAHLGKLLVKVKTSSLLGSEARIRRVSLENGYFRLRKYDDSTTNLSRLLAPMQNKPPKEPQSPEEEGKGGLPWNSISLDRLTVKHIDFSADTTLALQDINLSARNLHYSEEGASGRINNLTLRKGDEMCIRDRPRAATIFRNPPSSADTGKAWKTCATFTFPNVTVGS